MHPDRPHTNSLGIRGEELAAQLLEARGHVVLARNWRLRSGALRGELDLVTRAPDGPLVFVEVKTRRSDRFGGPLAAIPPRKQAKIRALGAAFLRETGVRARAVRFDVVGVWLRPGCDPQLSHVRSAF